MNEEMPGETESKGADHPDEGRRDFLRSMGKWSVAAITASFGVAWLGCAGPLQGGWVNRRVGVGGGWINGGGWVNRAGGWINGGGGGGWVNRRVGGGGGWINRR